MQRQGIAQFTVNTSKVERDFPPPTQRLGEREAGHVAFGLELAAKDRENGGAIDDTL
jgi:hypothetical protein